MAERELEKEVIEITDHIKTGNNFLLSGGAGSGKTYSLRQVIRTIIEDYPTSKVACITYTNTAVKEITDKLQHTNLTVSTIHDFLWDNIHLYQNELKKSLVELINEGKIKKPIDMEEEININFFNTIEKGIQYKEFIKIKEGIISHDELIIIAHHLFKNYPKLCDILKDKYQFIFVDEYQDTSPFVIEILLEYLNQTQKKIIVGFFGDSMQSIYDNGIGDLNKYVELNVVKEVIKEQNRRNPQLVIDLANKLRSDRVQQQASTDQGAPNMDKDGTIKKGNICFLYSEDKKQIEEVKKSRFFASWNFQDSEKVKELNLTHNLIATKAGYPTLMDIYDNDPIIELKKGIVEKIKKEKDYFSDKISDLTTFDEVVDMVKLEKGKKNEKRLVKDILLENPEHRLLYDFLKDRPFSEVRKIYIDKDSLIDDKKQDTKEESKKGSKRDRLIKHLFKIQTNIHLYQSKNYNEFLRRAEFKIRNIVDKKIIKNLISQIEKMRNNTIEEVIEFADINDLCKKDDSYMDFITYNDYLYNRVKKVKFEEFQNLYKYLEGHTPFSTQHKIKGDEFDNVLVILDNGKWNKYNFETLFGKGQSKDTVLKRTQKIFYVCCTRAKENLVVYFDSADNQIVTTAKKWFGEENVHRI